jgi:hypothetical protein
LLEGTDSMGSPDPIPAADLPAFEPSTISAEDLHRQASFARAFENSWRLRLAFILLAFRESRLHHHLGSSSVEAYAEKHFRLDHRSTREMVRVAEALKELPRLREAYLMGQLDWSLVVELIRVAAPETEEEWLAFAEKKPVRAIKLEIENALEKKRKRPRKNGYSLPDATVFLRFKLRRSQSEIVLRGMQKVSEEIARSLNGVKPPPEETLVFMSRYFMETDPAGSPGARVDRDDPLSTILYHLCPPCREKRGKAHLITRDGPVEVPVEEVERVEANARKVVISPEEEDPERRAGDAGPNGNGSGNGNGNGDGNGHGEPRKIDPPNTAALLRKLRLRDGGTCQNPFCRRTVALQGAHLERRSEGGPTTLANEVLLCVWCHALEDQKLLEIRGNPLTSLEFITPADTLNVGLREELRSLASAPLVTVPVNGGPVNGGPVNGTPGSGTPANGGGPGPRAGAEEGWGSDEGLARLAGGLEQLGHRRRESREAVRQAREALLAKGAALGAQSILRMALQILHPNRSAGTEPGPPPCPG